MLKISGDFNSAHGKLHVIDGLRDIIKPNWRDMFLPIGDITYVPDEQGLKNADSEVSLMEKELEQHEFTLKGKDVLEVGCHMGKHSYRMSEKAKSVRGIDVLEYGIRQSSNLSRDEAGRSRQQKHLDDLRRDTKAALGISQEVFFENLDVLDMDLHEEFDLITSWDVLEHVVKPQLAIENMYDALRPKGMCYHRYNPFFSINGGHSLCTTDIIYGHCILGEGDFERYIATYRPSEYNQAMSFYKENLNRLTINELTEYCEEAGFRILDVKKYSNIDREKFGGDLAEVVLPMVQKNYHRASLEDLIYDTVDIILCKP